MQITEKVVFIWALDISPPHVTRAAIGVLAAVRRVRGPDRRTSGKGGATSDALGARASAVTPGRSPRSTRRRVGGAARGSGHGVPDVILRAAPDGGAQVGSIVMAPSPPRYLARRPRSAGTGPPVRRSGRGAAVGPPASGVASFTSSSCASHIPSAIVRAIRRNRPSTSPVPVAHGTAPSRLGGFRGGTPSPHQFQLRMARSFPVVGPRGRTRRLRTIVRAAQRSTETDEAGCGRAGTRVIGPLTARGARGVRPSITWPRR
ncbi:MAG: hypothetical protein QOK35_3460, partial [Pseudonocardiales bacterium]|nr:hypothetical protein [Pseudonocardiales bacterium]